MISGSHRPRRGAAGRRRAPDRAGWLEGPVNAFMICFIHTGR